MSKTVTTESEVCSVSISISYVPHEKLHLVAELFRFLGDRRTRVDIQSEKTSAAGASRDLSGSVGEVYSRLMGRLSAPVNGVSYFVSVPKHWFHRDDNLLTNDEYGYDEVGNLIYLLSRSGSMACTLQFELLVEVVCPSA